MAVTNMLSHPFFDYHGKLIRERCVIDENGFFLIPFRRHQIGRYVESGKDELAGFDDVYYAFVCYLGPEVETLQMPDGVERILAYSLSNSNLKNCRKIVFPESVSIVEPYALTFGEYHSLKEIEFYGNVWVHKHAFDYVIPNQCNDEVGIEKLIFHKQIKAMEYAFRGARIRSLNMEYSDHRNVTFMGIKSRINDYPQINDEAFSHCPLLEEVSIPKIERLGDKAFYDCPRLRHLEINPKCILGKQAFDMCGSLLTDGVINVNDTLFGPVDIPVIPEGIRFIPEDTLYSSDGSIKTYSLPSTLEFMGRNRGARVKFSEDFFENSRKIPQKLKDVANELFNEIVSQKNDLSCRDWMSLYLFQTGKNYETFINSNMATPFDRYAEEIPYLLEKCGTPESFNKAMGFVKSHPEIPQDIISRIKENSAPFEPVMEESDIKHVISGEEYIMRPFVPKYKEPAFNSAFKTEIDPGRFTSTYANTVFRGFKETIDEAVSFIEKQIGKKIKPHPTKEKAVWEFVISNDYENDIVDRILVTFPELKMAAFFEKTDDGVYLCYSPPGYPYLLYHDWLSGFSHSGEELYTITHRPDDKNFTELIEYGSAEGEWFRYTFTYRRDWNKFDYLLKIDSKLYKVISAVH